MIAGAGCQWRRRRAGPLNAVLAADHQRAGDHVVQRLLALGKASHDVTDEQNHAGKVFCKMTSGSAREGYAIAVFRSVTFIPKIILPNVA